MYKIYLWKANGIPKYVGSTKQKITRRIQQHYSDKKSAIYKYIREHPNEEFSYVAIDFANTKEEAFEKESFWTEFYRERYSMLNIFTGSTPDENTRKVLSEQRKGKPSPKLGKHLSDETKRKLSEALKGKHRPEKIKKKISKTLKGKKKSEEHKEKLRIANLGKHLSKETRRKLSEANKGKFVGEKNPAAKKVRIKESNQIFDTINDAAEFLNVGRQTVRYSIKNNKKMRCGFTAEFYKDDK